ncbi:MAG TPA: hypothetical protein VMI94_03285 [Bryobacteraceae bacterium]|nr:hypothetical protein [Bryobacteraceae bacterium]
MAQSATMTWAPPKAEHAGAIPWYIWTCVIAITSASVGGIWDISWHKSIGRDTFWTAPHMLIQLCGILAGISCGYLILSSTFGRPAASDGSVRIWGFRGPLGAFVAAWGGVAMITSAPFDNWWHDAYGLDVKVLSPPHVLLIFGILVIRVGTLLLIMGHLNRLHGHGRRGAMALLLYTYTFLLVTSFGIFQEFLLRNYMHSALFYMLMTLGSCFFLAGLYRMSDYRWSGTVVCGIYTVLNLLYVWILPLFPAEPKLGPVYQNITHFVPPDFPILVIVPAFLLDLTRPYWQRWGLWLRAAAIPAIFLAALMAVQWPFADFLMTPAAHNRIFGSGYFPFFVPSTTDWVRNVFSRVEPDAAHFWTRIAWTLILGALMARAGSSWGAWMRKVQR